MTSPPPSPSQAKVQRVSKASSDKLLRKFAALDNGNTLAPANIIPQRHSLSTIKRSRKTPSIHGINDPFPGEASSVDSGSCKRLVKRKRSASGRAVAEWKSLLPASPWRLSDPAVRRWHADVELAGINRLMASVEKTWSRTIEGASKVFIERNSNHHVRLIGDDL